MKFFKQRFAAAPEGTAVLFFIVSRLLPAALDRYPRGLTGHVAHPSRSIVSRLLPAALDRYPRGLTGHVAHLSRSIQIFSKLGFAALCSTPVC